MLVSVDMFVPDENASLLSQQSRINGKGKIAIVAIVSKNPGVGAFEQLLGSRYSRQIPVA